MIHRQHLYVDRARARWQVTMFVSGVGAFAFAGAVMTLLMRSLL